MVVFDMLLFFGGTICLFLLLQRMCYEEGMEDD
jgi:hypothetical protein